LNLKLDLKGDSHVGLSDAWTDRPFNPDP